MELSASGSHLVQALPWSRRWSSSLLSLTAGCKQQPEEEPRQQMRLSLPFSLRGGLNSKRPDMQVLSSSRSPFFSSRLVVLHFCCLEQFCKNPFESGEAERFSNGTESPNKTWDWSFKAGNEEPVLETDRAFVSQRSGLYIQINLHASRLRCTGRKITDSPF